MRFRRSPPHLALGRRAERRAERLLKRRGLRTVARNFSRRTGEIDLIMLEGDTLVFVEVRFRSPGAWLTGLASVDPAKQRRLVRTAETFLHEHPEHRFRVTRFDVVSASKRHYRIACEWTPDAFEAMDAGA